MTPPLAPANFREEGRVVIHGVRTALADMLQSVNADPAQPQEISRRFDLDKMLTWRVSRVVCGDDAWEAVEYIPRRPSMQLFANAMVKHGARDLQVQNLWQAMDAFDRFMDIHAGGDRDTLEIMTSSAGSRFSSKRLEQFRKDGYLANSALWGISTNLHLAIRMMAPGSKPGMVDLATVCGFVGFRRLRENVKWTVASVTQWDSAPDQHNFYEALDLETTGIPLIPKFSSKPVPSMHARKERDHDTAFKLNDGPVGHVAAATVMLGWITRNCAPLEESYPGEQGEHGAALSTPAELLLHDFYVHKSLAFALDPSVRIYGQLPGGPRYPQPDGEEAALPVQAELASRGFSPPDTTTPEFSRYREVVDMMCSRLGHSLRDFHGYRLRLKYPPIPAISVISHRLAERG
jgi:hypothetical protein